MRGCVTLIEYFAAPAMHRNFTTLFQTNEASEHCIFLFITFQFSTCTYYVGKNGWTQITALIALIPFSLPSLTRQLALFHFSVSLVRDWEIDRRMYLFSLPKCDRPSTLNTNEKIGEREIVFFPLSRKFDSPMRVFDTRSVSVSCRARFPLISFPRGDSTCMAHDMILTHWIRDCLREWMTDKRSFP